MQAQQCTLGKMQTSFCFVAVPCTQCACRNIMQARSCDVICDCCIDAHCSSCVLLMGHSKLLEYYTADLELWVPHAIIAHMPSTKLADLVKVRVLIKYGSGYQHMTIAYGIIQSCQALHHQPSAGPANHAVKPRNDQFAVSQKSL